MPSTVPSDPLSSPPAEIEAIGYLTGAVTGYERAGGSSPVIVVPVGYVRTLLAALAAQEAARRDSDDSARLIDFTRYLAERFPVSCAFLRFDGGQSVVRDFNAARTAPTPGAEHA